MRSIALIQDDFNKNYILTYTKRKGKTLQTAWKNAAYLLDYDLGTSVKQIVNYLNKNGWNIEIQNTEIITWD